MKKTTRPSKAILESAGLLPPPSPLLESLKSGLPARACAALQVKAALAAWHHGIHSPGLDPSANLGIPPTLAVPSFMPSKGRPFDFGELRGSMGSRAGLNGRCSGQGTNRSQGHFNAPVPSRTRAAEAGSVLHASCRRSGHVGSWPSPRCDVASARSSRTNHLMATQTIAPRARQKVQASWSSFC